MLGNLLRAYICWSKTSRRFIIDASGVVDKADISTTQVRALIEPHTDNSDPTKFIDNLIHCHPWRFQQNKRYIDDVRSSPKIGLSSDEEDYSDNVDDINIFL